MGDSVVGRARGCAVLICGSLTSSAYAIGVPSAVRPAYIRWAQPLVSRSTRTKPNPVSGITRLRLLGLPSSARSYEWTPQVVAYGSECPGALMTL